MFSFFSSCAWDSRKHRCI